MPLFAKLFLLFLALQQFSLIAWAHNIPNEKWKPAEYSAEKAYAPSPIPERITLTWNGDPSTTQAVTWRTDTSVKRAVADIALANANGRAMKKTRVSADTTFFESDINKAHYHSVTFKNLQPDTLYAYRVGDGKNWSEFFHFKTAKAAPAPFSFIYFGDAQNDVKTHWSRVFREAFRDAPRASFILHAGDLIDEDYSDAEWGEWHGAAGWVNGTIPILATPGNHEYYRANRGPEEERIWRNVNGEKIQVIADITEVKTKNSEIYKIHAHVEGEPLSKAYLEVNDKDEIIHVSKGIKDVLGFTPEDILGTDIGERPVKDRIRKKGQKTVSEHWKTQFDFPRQSPPEGLEETCYYIDYQGVRLISLDSNQLEEEQVPWLRKVLEDNPNTWTIVTFHHPMFSPSKGRDNPSLREHWKPLLDKYRVDLVLNGHDHTYARTGKLNKQVQESNVAAGYKQAYDPNIGTVYVVSVSGPKMYNITNKAFAKKTAENTQLYQIINVDQDKLIYQAYKATGELYDAFELTKQPGKANLLVELLDK